LSNVQKFRHTWINVESYSTAAEVGSISYPSTVSNVQKKKVIGGGVRFKSVYVHITLLFPQRVCTAWFSPAHRHHAH